MEIQQMKYFIEVVRNRSYTRAANKLFVTQPILTRVIKSLEKELGVKLIERTSKHFSLTDAGKLFYEKSEAFLLGYDDLLHSMKDLCLSRIGEVKLSTPSVLLDTYFPTILKQFNLKHPGIDISITEEGSKLVATAVASGRADLGLVMLPVERQDRFETHTVLQDVCQLAISRNHPFARLNSVDIRDLRDERILTFSETATLHDVFLNMCTEHGFVPRIAYKSLTSAFISSMISSNQCIGVLPLPIIQHGLSSDLVTVPLEPKIYWEIAIIRRRDGYHSYASTQLFKHICEYFANLPSGPVQP